MFGQKIFNAHVYTDTIYDRVTSIHGNRYGQVFAKKDYFVDVYPIKKKSHCVDVLSEVSRIMVFLSRCNLDPSNFILRGTP